MKNNHIIQAKSTKSLLQMFPQEFVMVKDINSNGYKFANIVFGTEIDEARERLKILYDNIYLDTMDLSDDPNIYTVSLSGSPMFSGYLNSDSFKIKITNEDEFYNGDPTRLIYKGQFIFNELGTKKVIGVGYFRTDPTGSGYILLNYDINQTSGYILGSHPQQTFYIDNEEELTYNTLQFNGINTQNYETSGFDEIISPVNMLTFSGKYPQYRKLTISGVTHFIDHYEPYRGWIYNENGDVTAVNDYFQSYYFNEDGDKIYHRTMLNNPYGSGNYNTQYLRLNHVPISGTLKVYDMDILDTSGNATEINRNGTPIYYLSYNKMVGSSGVFEPTYKGYYPNVPSGVGFIHIEGSGANLIGITSWKYQKVGSRLDVESGVWIEPGSGALTNLISITNPHSRYIVEYDWSEFNKSKYITSLDGTRYLSSSTDSPIYSLENLSGNVFEVDYKFTTNPEYITSYNGVTSDRRPQIITFDGWNIRPKSRIHKIDFNIPIIYSDINDLSFFSIPFSKTYIGYSNDFVPQVTPIRSYYLNCPFDNVVTNYSTIEDDLTGNSNLCVCNQSGLNKLFRVPYGTSFGKKIIHLNLDSYYSGVVGTTDFLRTNYFFKFGFKPLIAQDITLLDYSNSINNNSMRIYINNSGYTNVTVSGFNFVSRLPIVMDDNEKEIIVRYLPDDLNPLVPVVEIFIKDQNYHFDSVNLYRQEVSTTPITNTHLHLFKNCTIDIGSFQIYSEAF